MDLIYREWRTDARGTTDAGGGYTTRAYYGDYRITVTDRAGHTVTKTATLPMGSGAKTVTLTLP
jgi:hypothetical protein